MRRDIRSAILFAAAVSVAAWLAWPRPSASIASPVDRVEVVTMVLLLAGLPLLARLFFGPVGSSRLARVLRFGTWAAVLGLIPARIAVEQFGYTPPRGGIDLRVYLLIANPRGKGDPLGNQIVFLVVMALYLTAMLWMTSRRSRIVPATLAIGAGSGAVLGVVMYTVAPLGLSSAATNPWLPGSDIDPLMLTAWLLVIGGPLAAGVVADWRYTASSSAPQPPGARVRQLMAAGLLTSLTGALFVTVLGTGTIAAMLKAPWLRNWLYHGHHLLYGVQNLSSDLTTLPAIAYSHEMTGAADLSAFLVMGVAFPLVALGLTGFGALTLWESSAPSGGSRPPGDGGPPRPELPPDPPDGIRRADFDVDALLADLSGHEPGPDIELDPLVGALEAVVSPNR
jgi:hypothetical protein